MGNPFLLQACLRLKGSEIPNDLEIGKKYHFSKPEHRLYQINVPMDLRTEDWKFLGRVVVTEFTVGNGITKGTFVPVKMFTEEEKQIMTKTYVSDKDVSNILEK